MQATRNANDLWLSYWVGHTHGPAPSEAGESYFGGALPADVRFYLSVLLCIASVNTLFTLARAFSFAKVGGGAHAPVWQPGQ